MSTSTAGEVRCLGLDSTMTRSLLSIAPLAAFSLVAPAPAQVDAFGEFWSAPTPVPQSLFGETVLDVGDQNGDGRPDVLATSPREPVGADILVGSATLLSGRDGSVIARLFGKGAENEQFGSSALVVGDLDQDGDLEFAIGARGHMGIPNFQTGALYLFDGGTQQPIGFIAGSAAGDALGAALGLLDDVDLDGWPDVVNGTAGVAVNGELGAGRVDAYSLRTGDRLWTRDNPWSGASQVWSNFGFALTTTADSDMNGSREVWVGAPNLFRSVPSLGNVKTGALYRLDGANGDVRDEVLIDREQALGYDLDSLPDVDGDGAEDVVVGAFGQFDRGAVYAIDGRFGTTLFERIGTLDGYGFSVAYAGDFDGNGRPDVAVADLQYLLNSEPSEVEILDARLGAVVRTLAAPAGSEIRFGQGLGALGDLGGDGNPEIVVADPFPFGIGEGRVFVYGDAVLGTSYCDAVPNSTGGPASLRARGSSRVAFDDVRLEATGLPSFSFALFFTGEDRTFVPGAGGGSGNLCVSGNVGRFLEPGQVKNSGSEGRVELTLDLMRIPSSSSGFIALTPGDTRTFQVWYRDVVPSGVTSNFTTALEIDFD